MAGKKSTKRRRNVKIPDQVAKKQKVEAHEEEMSKEERTCAIKDEFHEKMEELLKVEMPDDFYELFAFCTDMEPDSPKDALSYSLGLVLCGPYDIINGKLDSNNSSTANENDDKKHTKYHLHSKFYYDPPEFMTVIKETEFKTGFHIGYYRDAPNELPSLVASNESENGCDFQICGENLFAAISSYAEEMLKKAKDKSKQQKIRSALDKLKNEAKRNSQKLDLITPSIKARQKKVVTKSFHKIGLVVPLDQNDVGYRPLNQSDASLKKLCKRICEAKNESERNQNFDELHELITFVQFANDECDYGMGLELGIDLFCYGNEAVHGPVRQLLPLAYSLLGRDLYSDIISKHLEDRSKKPIDITDRAYKAEN